MTATDRRIIHYPALNNDEFNNACTCLESKCQDKLNETEWVRVVFHEQYLDIVKTIRVAQVPEETGGTPCQYEYDTEEDRMLVHRMNELEQEVCTRSDSNSHEVKVVYSVVLSPSYQVPVLWIHLFDVPSSAPTGLEALYQYLVPTSAIPALRSVGVIGALSFGVSDCYADRRKADILVDTSAYGRCRFFCPSM